MFHPNDAPIPGKTPSLVDERLKRLEEAIEARDAAFHGAFHERLQRMERALDQLGKLQAEHHFVLQGAMSQAPAIHHQLGGLYQSIAERMNMEHHQLQMARQQAAEELQGLSKAAAEVRQLVNESLPATQEAADLAARNLAVLADDVKVERGALKQAIGEALQVAEEKQSRLVMVVAVSAALVSSMVAASAVLVAGYLGG